jgi:Uri superfamily endonuclease
MKFEPAFEEAVFCLPVAPGVYAVHFRLQSPVSLTIGSLGIHLLAAGEYIYVGSARGAGGIRARLGRHLRGSRKVRWHVDFLRSVSQVEAFAYEILEEKGDLPVFKKAAVPAECRIIQAICQWDRAYIPVAGFGASDCRHGCAAHLVGFPAGQTLNADMR